MTLTRSGPFNKKQLIKAALEYADMHNGKVPFVDNGKMGYVVFEKCGVVWVFKEIIKT